MSAPTLHTVHGQPSWSLKSSHVHAHLTRLGGHLAPVNFRLGSRTVQPFSIAPWAEEKIDPKMPVLIKALRGDFFCAPFGGNGTPYRGEKHPPHGEPANGTWRLKSFERAGEKATFHAQLDLKIRRGSVEKSLTLVEGHTAVYQRHALTAKGPMPVGHHAMVKFPDEPGSGIVSTSRFVRAQVFPTMFEQPESFGYQSLKPAAEFRTLDKVPRMDGGVADLTSYPARFGFEDLVMLTADPKLALAWTAVTFPKEKYVYFALRDPQVLRHTILWHSNAGRHYAPWSGRHRSVLGIEDTMSYFHYGLAESAGANPINKQGITTAHVLDPKKPLVVNYIIGVAAIPAGFDRVKEIRGAKGEDGIELVAANGKRVSAKVDVGFLKR